MSQKYEGALELTWTNKHLRLLAHDDGTYEWVPPADYRVAEVRLLDTAGTVGDAQGGRRRAADNLLIRGDALNALNSLAELPEFADELVGKVKLAYMDPPFNTQLSWLRYDDALEHSVWLTLMRDRLVQIRKLLAANGSIWVHCDDSEGAHLRVLMDELFPNQFVATVIWQKRYSRDNRPAIGTVHDYIHVYSPLGGDWKHHRNRIPRASAKEYRNPNNDREGPWRVIPMDAQGFRANQMYDVVTPVGAVKKPPKGRCWSMIRERFDELLADGPQNPPSRLGRIYFGKDGRAQPGVIRYFHEDEGLVPWTWWPHGEVGHNDESKKEQLELHPDVPAFDTPKPERLMERIIRIATDPDDIVLDCFLGSGSTAAVAHKLGRRWVGIERDGETLDLHAIPRLTKVVAGEDPGGITDDVGWQGGGGFGILDVAPSMFVDVDGLVLLADWATNGKLAEATAAQLHYEFAPEPPFCGRRGRRRLAVIDGLVNEDVVRLLERNLADNEQLVVCGTAIDPAAGAALKALRPGSSVRKIPAALLGEYRRAQWVPRTDAAPKPAETPDEPHADEREHPAEPELASV